MDALPYSYEVNKMSIDQLIEIAERFNKWLNEISDEYQISKNNLANNFTNNNIKSLNSLKKMDGKSEISEISTYHENYCLSFSFVYERIKEVISGEKIMKILVLGANGNLGTSLVPKLIETNKYEVVPFTRRDCNVMDLKDLKEKIEKVSPDVIINTVAYNKVDACENDLKEQELAIALNMRLPKNLALICEERNIKLIHFSTNYVFSGEKETYTEFD